jgi:hypothetical protein
MIFKVTFITLFISAQTWAIAQDWKTVVTPYGTELGIKINESLLPNAPLLIVAPGQSCNSKGSLFELIEQEAQKQEVNVVRFEWSYCSPSSTQKNPADDLSSEIKDMEFAINYSKDLFKKTNRDLYLTGKSLGSMVAYRVFETYPDLKALVLLTPICSMSRDEQNNPLPAPIEKLNEFYPDILKEARPIQLISGNKDSLCDHTILKKIKSEAFDSLDVVYTLGDHGFRIFNSDNSANQPDSLKNQQNVAESLLEWFPLHSF